MGVGKPTPHFVRLPVGPTPNPQRIDRLLECRARRGQTRVSDARSHRSLHPYAPETGSSRERDIFILTPFLYSNDFLESSKIQIMDFVLLL